MNIKKVFITKIKKLCDKINSVLRIGYEENGSPVSPEPPGEGSRYDGTWKELVTPLFGIIFYAAPTALVLLPVITPLDSVLIGDTQVFLWLTWLFFILLITIGIFLFICSAAQSGGQDTKLDKWPLVERPSVNIGRTGELDSDILLTEYETIAEEARYRDRLLLRTGYFSLAAFAVLITIHFEVSHPRYQTGITMIGTLISLAFAIAVVSYKDARDPLWERMRVIELSEPFKHKLTSFHTLRTRGERRLFDHLSLSGYIVTLQIFFLLLWLLLYLLTLLTSLGTEPPV